jgi:hypothetical protein
MEETLSKDALSMMKTGIFDEKLYMSIEAVLKRHRGN